MNQKGFSLLEILVVLTVFSLLAIISTTTVLLSLRGTQKSAITAKVRQNIDFTVATVERQIRNANNIVACNSDQIIFTDQDSVQTSFACTNLGSPDAYVASGSARLTSADVTVTSCSFFCSGSLGSTPPSVTFNISASDKNLAGAQGSSFTTTTQIYLRSY